MRKIQYFYCPSCGGILQRDRVDGFSITRIPSDTPRCTVCGKYYVIQIDEKLVVTVKELGSY